MLGVSSPADEPTPRDADASRDPAPGRDAVHEIAAVLQRISAKGGAHLVVLPAAVAEDLRAGGLRGRALVTLLRADGTDGPTWHAGVNPFGGGQSYVQVGRNYHEPLGFAPGDTVRLRLRRDRSRYGMRPCEEYLAVAADDPAGEALFRAELTAGTQRSLLHRIGNGRTSEARIERAIRVFDQLHLGVSDRQTLLRSIRADAMRAGEGVEWG